MTSKLFTLTLNDFEKGLIVAVLAPCAGYIGQCLQAFSTGGTFSPDWGSLLKIAITAGFAYITKNFLTSSQGVFLGSEPSQP